MKLDQRLRLLDQLDSAPVSGQRRTITAEAEDLAQWATHQLGRPVAAHQVQAILDQPAPVPTTVETTALVVPVEKLPSPTKTRGLLMLGSALTLGGLTIALTHALGPMSGLVYVAVGPIGGLMLGKGMRGWLDRRTAKAPAPSA